MHMDNLEGSLDAPVFNPRRPVVGQMSFGAGQPEYGGQVTLFVLKLVQDLGFRISCPYMEGMNIYNTKNQMGIIKIMDKFK